MATRVVNLKFKSLTDFLKRWDSEIKNRSLFLPPGTAADDLAAEFKLDLALPLGMRLGPFTCQVVHRGGDGSYGVQIPEIASSLQADIDALFQMLEDARDWYIENGEVVPASEVPDVTELEAQIEAQRKAPPPSSAANAAPAKPAGPRVRGLVLPNLSGQEPIAKGTLDNTSFRDLLIELAVQGISGLLTLVTSDGTKRYGFWQKGGPVGWRSDPIVPEETLGMLLLKANHITKEQLAESLQMMEANDTRQGEALIEMGILNFGQLISVLEKQVEFVLQSILAEPEGVWAFHTVEDFEERFINPPARVPSMLYRALRDHSREMPREQLMEKHQPNLDYYVHFDADTVEIIDEIKFSNAESKFLSVIRSNSWRLRELFTVTNLSKSQTACVLWAFDELNLLEYRDSEALERYLQRVSARILSKVRTLGRATHFDVLEVHWICLQDEVDIARDRLLKEFDAATYHDLTDDLSEGIQRIRTKIEEAHSYLKVKRNRMAYREEIVEKDTILNSADLLAKKGEMAIMKADGREAVMCWSKAVELVPNNKSFKDGLQRSRGLGASG